MFKKSKQIVRELPGFTSYCSCTKLCSNLEVDHMIPKHFLKKKLVNGTFNQANSDMHNLFRCCNRINNPKGHKLLGVDWDAGDHSTYLARTALYMDMQYDLGVPEDLLLVWKEMALRTDPLEFEHERNEIIKHKQGRDNPFISEFPSSIIYYQ